MKRPVVFMCLYYICGLLLGYYIRNIFAIGLLFLMLIIITVVVYKIYLWKFIFLFPLICFFAFLQTSNRVEINGLSNSIQDTTYSTIEGVVLDIQSDRRYILKTSKLEINGKKTLKEINIIVYKKQARTISIGDIIAIKGYISKPSIPRNPGGFDEVVYFRTRNIAYKFFERDYELIDTGNISLQKELYEIRLHLSGIYDKLFPEKEAGIIKAMILGDRKDLNIDIKELYSSAGISHILAISGLHIQIIGFGLYLILCKVLNKRYSVLIVILFLIFYCILTGLSVSTIRASLMMTLLLLARLFGRSADMYTSLAIAALILLIINPFYLWEVGFLLSFLAVIGIALLMPLLESSYNKNKNEVITLFNVSLAVTITTSPVIAYFFYELHLYSIIVNILVVPLLSIVIFMAIIAMIIGNISIYLGKVFAGMVYYILNFYEALSVMIEKLPGYSIVTGRPDILIILIYYCILIIFSHLLHHKEKYAQYYICIKKVSIGVILGIFFIIVIFRILPQPLEITILDVGQGDCTIIQSPGRLVYVLDGGGNPLATEGVRDIGYYTILPFLKYNGISKVDCIIVSHTDTDHIKGLIELLDYIEVDKIVIARVYEESEDRLYNELMNKAKIEDIHVIYIEAGDIIEDKDIKFYCLYPFGNVKNYKNNNANSLVFNLVYKEFNILLTGDIEKEQEKDIVEKYNILDCDILKVPHHGSKTSSTPKFIQLVLPEVAIISCGVNNRYGHPSQTVIDIYDEYNTQLYGTYLDGAITIFTDGYNYSVHRYLSGEKSYFSIAIDNTLEVR